MSEVKEYKLPSRNGRLHGTYTIPQPVLREAAKKFPNVNVDVQIIKMVDWLEKEPDRQKKDEWYPEFILNWFARAAGHKIETDKRGQTGGQSGGNSDQMGAILKEIKLINERIGTLQRLLLKRLFAEDGDTDASKILEGANLVEDGEEIDADFEIVPSKKAPSRDDEDLPF